MHCFIKIGIFIFLCKFLGANSVIETSFHIGGIFDDEDQASAFRLALNLRTSEHVKFYADVIPRGSPDVYTTLKHVCHYTSGKDSQTGRDRGWVALVDVGESTGTCNALCQLCAKVEIPQLFITWRPPEASAYQKSTFGLAYYPQPSVISRAYATLIKHHQWPKFTLLYEDGSGLIRLQEILKSRPPKAEPVIIRKLDPVGDNMILFKTLLDEKYFVIDCDANNINKYMEEISMVNNHTFYQNYIFTSLDAHIVDLRANSKFEGNVSTFHMTDKEESFWIDTSFSKKPIKLQTALTVDAAVHFSIIIENIVASNPAFAQPTSICEEKYGGIRAWENGSSILQALKAKDFTGLTGNIDFANSSYRQNFLLKYWSTTKHGLLTTGFWNSATDILTITSERKVDDGLTDKSVKKIRVVSKEGKPYFGTNPKTNESEGFAVDLVNKIFELINKEQNGTKYEIEFYKTKTLSNDEMIQDLRSHTADLAICDLTMTSDRQARVDFSSPFMNLGISILYVQPEKNEPDKWSFIKPLALDLWLYLGTAYIGVSFVLLICARMSQQDWVNPHPCNRNPESLENIWTLYNCTWLSMGTIMTQGCDILPRAPGSRWVAGMWWFFALIITASYTANVSTFVSNSRKNGEIENVKDLANQNKIQYGTVVNASTYKFFRDSNNSIYKKIFSTMESTRPTVYTQDNDEGRERVVKGKRRYAFFMESTSIEYYVQRNRNLSMIGGLLDAKDYGIAMPKKSPLRIKIDDAILKLQVDGVIEQIKKLWWEEKDNDKEEEEETEEDESSGSKEGSLKMENTSGIFLVLLAGGVLGLVFAATDFIMHAHKIASVENINWKDALRSEWRSSLDCRVLSKPVAPPRSRSPSPAASCDSARRSTSRAVSVLRAAQSFINLNDVY